MRSLAAPLVLLARIVRIVAAVVVAIIGLDIVFVALGANAGNTIVSHISSWSGTLAGPFDNVFTLSSHKGTVALNNGLAIVVYVIAAAIISRLLLAPALTVAERRRAMPAAERTVPAEDTPPASHTAPPARTA